VRAGQLLLPFTFPQNQQWATARDGTSNGRGMGRAQSGTLFAAARSSAVEPNR
jgi:hypothetical protein